MSTAGPLVIVLASSASTSLPGAVLADLGGRPALALQLARLAPLRSQVDATLVVATTDRADDDDVAALAADLGHPVVRGAAGDPLDACAVALVRHPAEAIALVPGTGPLSDPFVVQAVLDLHRTSGADLASNLLPRSYPRGIDVEVVGARALRLARLEAHDAVDHQTVTAYLQRRPERFRLANVLSGHDVADERWVLDTAADLDRLREIVAQTTGPETDNWSRILSVVGRKVRPMPDEVSLRPTNGSEPGASPWVRRWSVVVNGQEVGTCELAVGEGRSSPDVQVPDPWREATRAALYRLLLDDPQATA